MRKTYKWYLILMGAVILTLSGCFQSTPETPQEAVEEVRSQLSLAGTAWQVESMLGGPDDAIPIIPGTRLSFSFR